jgi:Coenzyme PQQ synthesis protein D (PqqD)
MLSRTDRAVHGELPEETVLLDIEDGVAVRLNPSGAWLWGQLERPASVGELASALAARFEIDRAQALADVTAFAADLSGRSLLAAD